MILAHIVSKTSFIFSVDYSTLNYKDALVVSGNYAGIKLPMVGGIDLAGTVKQSDSPRFSAGDKEPNSIEKLNSILQKIEISIEFFKPV